MTALFQTTDSLLQGFLVVLTDTHHFADGLHLRAELIFHRAELFKGPTRKLQHHIVARRRVLFERTVTPVRQFIHRHPGSQLGRDECDREACRLRSKCRRTRRTRIDFNNHNTARARIMGKLHIRATNHADGFHNLKGHLLQAFHRFRCDRQHRSRAERVACMHTHRVNIFDGAHANHLILCVAHHLNFELFPPLNRLFHQNLMRHREVQALTCNRVQLFNIVSKAATCATHRVSRANHHRETNLFGNLFGLFHVIGDTRTRRLNAQLFHRVLEDVTVFTAFNCLQVHTDHHHTILVQNARLCQGQGHIQTRLTAEVRQNRIGAFLCNNLLQTLQIQRFDVGGVRHRRVRHDGGGVRVHKNNLITESAECFAGLGSGIVKLTSLADHNRTRTDNQHFSNIRTLHI